MCVCVAPSPDQPDADVGLGAGGDGEALGAGEGARSVVVQHHAQAVASLEGGHELFRLQIERHVQRCTYTHTH